MMVLTALGEVEAETADRFHKILSAEVQALSEIWGEKPYLSFSGVTFQQKGKDKCVIPVVELFFVLGGLYRHGNYYKATQIEGSPGKYEFQHKLINYKLSQATYRKTVEKRLIPILRSIIDDKNDNLPSQVHRMALKDNSPSIEVFFRFSGHRQPSLVISITPVLEGTNLPDGVNTGLEQMCHAMEVTINGHDGIGKPVWYLMPPEYPKEPQVWLLSFPALTQAVLDSSESLLHSVLFVTWIAEMRAWSKMGLNTPSEAMRATALSIISETPLFAKKCFYEQVTELLQKIQSGIKEEAIKDFCIPNRNYLSELSANKREALLTDIEEAMKQLVSTEQALNDYVRAKYPLVVPSVSAAQEGNKPEGNLTPSNTDQGTDSSSDSMDDNYMDRKRNLDNGGAGEGVVDNDPAPPLEVTELVSSERIANYAKENGVVITKSEKVGCSSGRLEPRGSKEATSNQWGGGWEVNSNYLLMAAVLFAILAAVLYYLPILYGDMNLFDQLASALPGAPNLPAFDIPVEQPPVEQPVPFGEELPIVPIDAQEPPLIVPELPPEPEPQPQLEIPV